MRRRMESLVVARAWAWGTILLAGTRTTRVGAMCLLPSMSIETTTGGLSISGCYRETVYLGLYQTIVWTLEGQDIMDPGTAAIVADLVSFTPCYSCVCCFSAVVAQAVVSTALSWSSKQAACFRVFPRHTQERNCKKGSMKIVSFCTDS